MQIKPGFTNFTFCTPSLGRLQNFVLIEYSVWEKMLCIKLPIVHQTFKKYKVVIQKMQQTSQNGLIINQINYGFMEAENFTIKLMQEW